MSYKLKQSVATKFDIIEKNTDTIIELKIPEQKAKDLCRKMNLGTGFNGFTPHFFANFNGLEYL
jgi:uncharacterized FlaG/YvyC family protein